MDEVREQIERKETLTPLKKKEIWSAVKESKFPIIMGSMSIVDASIAFSCSSFTYVWLAAFRVATFSEMSREGITRGKGTVRRAKVEQQYDEVADEIQKLQNIICSVADFQDINDEAVF